MESAIVNGKYITYGPQDTTKIAAEIAGNVKAGDVIALVGEMGAGKTVFVKGFVAAKQCNDIVTSPTFTLVNEYTGAVKIYHFDMHRLGYVDESQLDWLDDYLFGDGICIVEWAEFVSDILPMKTIKVHITKNLKQNEQYREIVVSTFSSVEP